MAKKYHIDINGDVVICRAFLRDCPRTDYTTEEAAYSALYLQKAAANLDNARQDVQNAFSNPNTEKEFVHSDFSGIDIKKSPRAYADKLDRDFYATGKTPEFFYVTSQLKQKGVTYDRNSQKVYLTRIPVPNYDDGEITSQWRLEVEYPESESHGKKEVYDLDLNNDLETELIRAENVLRESVIANSTRNTTAESINSQTNFLKSQIEKAYFTIEEEAQSPYVTWAKNDGYGTFANSDPMNIVVEANYNTTAFRGRLYERFLNETPYFDALTPNMDIRVYDNENGRSKNTWAIHFTTTGEKAEWRIETITDGGSHSKKVDSAEEAYSYIFRYNQRFMKDQSEETSARKATYVSDLITDIDLANNNFVNKKKVAQAKAEEDKIQRDSKKSLFGKKNSGTMGSILDLYS